MMTHDIRNLYDFHNTKEDILKKVGVKINTDNIWTPLTFPVLTKNACSTEESHIGLKRYESK